MDDKDGRLDVRELVMRCDASGVASDGGGGLPRQVTRKLDRPDREGCRRELKDLLGCKTSRN